MLTLVASPSKVPVAGILILWQEENAFPKEGGKPRFGMCVLRARHGQPVSAFFLVFAVRKRDSENLPKLPHQGVKPGSI